MRNTYGYNHARQARSRWSSVLAISASLAIVAGVALTSAGAASAVTLRPNAAPTLPCNVTVTGGGQLVTGTTLITGVVAGTTQIKFDCNATSGAAVAAEASLLAAISSSNVIPTSEADTASLGTFTASATDTGCPTGTAGSCTVATFAVPATFTASGDTNSVCPPTQAQVNAGLFGCAVAVANSTEAEVAGGEYLLQYASQTTAPAAPTISALQTTGSAGSLINVSDASGSTGYWWGDALQAIQALDAGTTGAVAPSTCTTGYGDVPSSDLVEAWYTAGSSTPTFAGPATGVTISNDCYTGTTLQPPVLGGTLTVPTTVAAGTAYTVYLCEVNATPYPSNDANSAKVCGTAAPFIDASFTFTAAAKALSQNLPVTASVATTAESAFSAQLTSSGNTGTVTYTQTAGSPGIVVSGSGAVTTSGKLTAGTYTASGTTADPNGDSGTFTFKLNVTGSVVTTTPPPKASRVVGWGIIGRTDIVTITGKDFTAGPKIIGHAGTVATVVRATASRITVRVRVVKSAKKGTFRFTIQFKNGKKTSVVYSIR
jgi:hypothetical protein